jgi:hypothetical protein
VENLLGSSVPLIDVSDVQTRCENKKQNESSLVVIIVVFAFPRHHHSPLRLIPFLFILIVTMFLHSLRTFAHCAACDRGGREMVTDLFLFFFCRRVQQHFLRQMYFADKSNNNQNNA